MNVGFIFGLIFALVLIGFIAVYGFSSASDLFSFGGEASWERRVSDFENAVKDVYTLSMGSRRTFEFRFSGGVERVCFINREDKSIWGNDPIMKAFVEDGKNLIVKKKHIKGYAIEHMKPRKNFCLDSSGNVLLVNMGRYVDVRMME